MGLEILKSYNDEPLSELLKRMFYSDSDFVGVIISQKTGVHAPTISRLKARTMNIYSLKLKTAIKFSIYRKNGKLDVKHMVDMLKQVLNTHPLEDLSLYTDIHIEILKNYKKGRNSLENMQLSYVEKIIKYGYEKGFKYEVL